MFLGVLLFSLYFSSNTLAQKYSPQYIEIKNADSIANDKKQQKIDSLFVAYEKDSLVESLVNDLYDYAKWHYRNTTVDQAIATSKKCIQFIENSQFVDGDVHKRVTNNLGFFYGKKKDYYNAYKAYNRLTTIGIKDRWTAEGYRLSGKYLRYLGDFYGASEYFEIAISIAKEINDAKILVNSCIDAGINYKQIGTKSSLKKGTYLLTELINSIEDKSLTNVEDISLESTLLLYNHLANLYNDRDDFDVPKSRFYYDKALDVAFKLKDSLSISLLYNDLGFLYLHDAKKETITYLDKALQYNPVNTAVSIVYGNKGLYYLKLKDRQKALYNAQLSINELTPVSTEKLDELPTKDEVLLNPFKYELLKSLIDKAKMWQAFYDETSDNDGRHLEHILETLKLADYLVDLIRLESNDQKSKLFWRETASEIYTNAVSTCFYLNKPEEAFYFMEKNKALLLLEDLSLRKQRENTVVPESVHERQLDLRSEILNYSTLLNTSEKKDTIRALLLTSKEAYRSFIDSLQTDFNFYYRTQKPTNTITISQAKEKLADAKEVYIEYILAEDEGYGLLISKESTQFFKIENYSTLLERAEKFRSLLEVPFKTQKDKESHTLVASSLYKSLFPKEISQQIANKNLIIIPDSYLQNVPFEALLTSNEATSYFIRTSTINYAYSISFLNENKNLKRMNTNDYIGFAPVNFKGGLSSLPESKFEVETASSLFSSTSFYNEDANIQNFMNNSKGYNIIHLASHSNVTDVSNPWIVFDDKKLSLDELYLIENTADLVVLSACKTSLGSLNEGEGVMSLARGFFTTGANSVLSTLWNVNDKSNSKIMVAFYEQLKKGKTKSEALRQAKLEYLNQHQLSEQSPYYWASFVLLGDSEAVPIDSDNNLLFIIFFGFLVLFISYLVFARLRK